MNITPGERMLRCANYCMMIVIRPSDKTTPIVILNREEYAKELEYELKVDDTYREVKADVTQKKLKQSKKNS